MTAAYRLAQEDVHVALYERSNDLGGLVGSFDFDGYPVDRFYHVVLPTDDRVRGLADELGLGDRWRFRPTKVGFYGAGQLFSMTSPKEFLTFPILRPRDRVRLAAFVLRCQLTKDYSELDQEPLLDWLRSRSGKHVVERMWAPLLDSKFDGQYDDLPATYIWARTRRMSKTRDKSGAEVMGWLEGGYQTLIDALEAKIRELGGEIYPGTAVEEITGYKGAAAGLKVEGTFRPFDFVLCTLAPPMARSLLSEELLPLAPADHCRYLGVVCLLLRTRRSISPYYHLNITDRRVPLTTIVETTHVVDPETRRWPPALRLQVRRSLVPAPPAAGRGDRERVHRAREDDLRRPERRRHPVVGRPARACDGAGAHRGRCGQPARGVLGAEPRAGLDGARLSGDRERPGCHWRGAADPSGDPRAPAPT